MRNTMRCGINIALAAVVIAMFLSVPADAHKINIFASADGKTISGYAYYPGGGRPSDAVVKIFGPGDTLLGEVKTDEEGVFEFEAKYKCDYILKIDTGDGHAAQWTVSADELPDDLPAYGAPEPEEVIEPEVVEEVPEKPVVREEKTIAKPARVKEEIETPVTEVATEAAPTVASDADYEALREDIASLRKQVEAYRRDINQYEEKVSINEIIGGIGFIFGIFGVAFYFLGLRMKKTREEGSSKQA